MRAVCEDAKLLIFVVSLLQDDLHADTAADRFAPLEVKGFFHGHLVVLNTFLLDGEKKNR